MGNFFKVVKHLENCKSNLHVKMTAYLENGRIPAFNRVRILKIKQKKNNLFEIIT